MSLRWTPFPAHGQSTDPASLLSFMGRLFRDLAAALVAMRVDFVQMKVTHVVPDKPRNGMLIEADGTDWDPGSGAGLYIYRSGSWVKVG